jgi:acyl-CoA thioester hydrolase
MQPFHTSTFRVRQYECDAYGHLNNVYYVRYLREAIAEANSAASGVLAGLAAAGRGRARRLDIEYLRPARYGDTLALQVSAPARRAGCVRQACEFRLAASGEVAAQAAIEVVLPDATSGEPADLPLPLPDEPPGPPAALPPLPPPPPGIFSIRRRVTWVDLDMNREVGDVTLLGYVEACGYEVVTAHRWPPERMAAQGFAIILRRHQIENLAPAALGDELEIATWASDTRRISATRHYTIRRAADGALLTRVDTLGVWVDLASGRPIRIPSEFLADFAPNLVV